MYRGPKLGELEREAPRGKGRRPQKKAQCPQLWTFSSRPPGLGKRRKGEGRMDLGGNLCVKRLVRMSTSPAPAPPHLSALGHKVTRRPYIRVC